MTALPFGTPLLIANPHAGKADARTLERLVDALAAKGVTADVARTDARGHARTLAHEAALEGRGLVVAVGGDGTVHEVVNGLLDPTSGAPVGPHPVVLGIVSAGSGSDLTRTFGLHRPPEILADHLCTDATLTIDVMQVTVRDATGQPRTSLAVNVVEAGYGATVVRRAHQLPRRLGPLRYAAGIVGAVPAFRRVPTTITHDAHTIDEPVCNVVVANGQFFGGGLRVAPLAMPTDGELDLQSWGGSPIDVLRAQPQLRRGTHLQRPDVRSWRARDIAVEAARPLHVEADGEVLGLTPMRVRVLPGALPLKL